MSQQQSQYEFPNGIERYLAALSTLYAQEGQRQKQEIIVNAQVRVHEGATSASWGDAVGHALYLTLPKDLYAASVREKSDLQNSIRLDIDKVHNCPGEFVASVFLEMAVEDGQDWRRESGVLQSGRRLVPADATSRVWRDAGYRVFLSHKDEVRKETAEIKAGLRVFGISCFVAHEDIRPTKKWEDEMEGALASMDAFVALMTDTFHESDWTDQEVGFAVGRAVPIIAVKLGRAPYGFLARFQALSCDWANAPKEITKLLIRYPRMLGAYIEAVEGCSSFEQGNNLAEMLPHVDHVTEEQAQRLVATFNERSNVHGSFGFNGTRPTHYGPGLAHHLSRATGRRYVTSSGASRIEVLP